MGIKNNLNGLYSLGADALGNMYEITTITPPKILVGKVGMDRIAGRIQNFSIPSVSQTPYSIHYKTGEITRASGKSGTPREFTFEIRVDREYDLYMYFYTWANIPNGTGNDLYYNDPDVYTGEIAVSRLKEDLTPVTEKKEKNRAWRFKNCWVSNIGELTLDWSNGEPLALSVTIQFSNMEIDDLEVPKAKTNDTTQAKQTNKKEATPTVGKTA